MRHRLVLTLLVAVLALGGAASAQSPTPQSTPVASPTPTAPRFPWPTLPPPGTPGKLDRFEPRGRPDASGGRFGVRIELWLSTDRARPGEWVQAHIRITNTRDEAVWTPGGCSRLAHIDVDLSGVHAVGVTQVGEAGRLKAAILERASRERSAFRMLDYRYRQGAVTVTRLALMDCNLDRSELARLAPGESLDVDAAWYPADELFEGTRLRRPLSPGTVRLIARYDHLGHGAQPDEDRDPRPVTVSTALGVAGSGPAYPSPGELVDAALRDPAFAAWVAASPGGADWENPYMTAKPGPGYPDQPRYAGLGDRAPHGVAEVWLTRRVDGTTAHGIGLVDPWTAEPIGFALQCGNDPCPEDWPGDPRVASPVPSPSPQASASVAP
jgi:hypothetical protein